MRCSRSGMIQRSDVEDVVGMQLLGSSNHRYAKAPGSNVRLLRCLFHLYKESHLPVHSGTSLLGCGMGLESLLIL